MGASNTDLVDDAGHCQIWEITQTALLSWAVRYVVIVTMIILLFLYGPQMPHAWEWDTNN
jgi:hypothetical protein